MKNECRWKIKKRGIREKKENKNDKDREEIKKVIFEGKAKRKIRKRTNTKKCKMTKKKKKRNGNT